LFDEYNPDVYFYGNTTYEQDGNNNSYLDGDASWVIGHINFNNGLLESFYFAEELGVRGFFVPNEGAKIVSGFYFYDEYIINTQSGINANTLLSDDNHILTKLNKRLKSINVINSFPQDNAETGNFNHSWQNFGETINFDFLMTTTDNASFSSNWLINQNKTDVKTVMGAQGSLTNSYFYETYKIAKTTRNEGFAFPSHNYSAGKVSTSPKSFIQTSTNPDGWIISESDTHNQNYVALTVQDQEVNLISYSEDQHLEYYKSDRVNVQPGAIYSINTIFTEPSTSDYGEQVALVKTNNKHPYQVIIADPRDNSNRGKVYIYHTQCVDYSIYDSTENVEDIKFTSKKLVQTIEGGTTSSRFGSYMDVVYDESQATGAMLLIGSFPDDKASLYTFTGTYDTFNKDDKNLYSINGDVLTNGMEIFHMLIGRSVGYNSSLGIYVTESNSNIPKKGMIIEPDLKTKASPGQFTEFATLVSPALFTDINQKFGFFIVPNGANLNNFSQYQTFEFEEIQDDQGSITYSGLNVESAEKYLLFGDNTINASGQFIALKQDGYCGPQLWEDVIYSRKPWYSSPPEPDYDDIKIFNHFYIDTVSLNEWQLVDEVFSPTQLGVRFGQGVAINEDNNEIMLAVQSANNEKARIYELSNGDLKYVSNETMESDRPAVLELSDDNHRLFIAKQSNAEQKIVIVDIENLGSFY